MGDIIDVTALLNQGKSANEILEIAKQNIAQIQSKMGSNSLVDKVAREEVTLEDAMEVFVMAVKYECPNLRKALEEDGINISELLGSSDVASSRATLKSMDSLIGMTMGFKEATKQPVQKPTKAKTLDDISVEEAAEAIKKFLGF